MRDQKQSETALKLAREVAVHEPRNAEALRQIAECLGSDLERPGDALAAYDALMALPDAEFSDYTGAGYLAAVNGRGDRARDIFRQAEEKFPETPKVQFMKGWALLNLHAPAEAIVAFQRYDASPSRTAE